MQTETPRVVLAIDLGTSGMKVALVTTRGQVLGWESEPVRLLLTDDGGAEQVPEEWWRALLAAAGRLLGRNLVPRHAVVAVCASTQGEGTIPVDAAGEPLMNAILWMDMRGAPYIKRRLGGMVNVAGASPRKLLRYVRLTGGLPSTSGKDPAGHMLLVKERFPDVYRQTHKFLNVLDYLNLRLTGRFAATFDSILTSWVTDNRDPAAIRYDAGLLSWSGVDADKFPDIVPCTQQLGALRPEVAEALGLSTTVVVVAGSIDNTAAAIGSGATEDFVPHLYVGTSSWVAAHVPFKKTDPLAGLASVPCAVPHRYLLTALQATAGGNITFLRDGVLLADDGLTAKRSDAEFFAWLERAAASVPPGSRGVLYTPWLWGERAPVEDRSLRAGFFNISALTTRSELCRAVLEGVAFNTKWLLGPVERFMKRPVEELRIAGGGASSSLWCQIFADVLGVAVRRVTEPVQANARGAAFIAAVGLGDIAFSDVPALVEQDRVFEPSREHRGLYEGLHEHYLALHRALRPLYARMNGRTVRG